MLFLTIVFFHFSKMTRTVRPLRVLTRRKKHGSRRKSAKYSEAKLLHVANWLNRNVSIQKTAEITKIPSSTVGEMAKNLRKVDGNVDVFVTRCLDHDRKCVLSSDKEKALRLSAYIVWYHRKGCPLALSTVKATSSSSLLFL